MLVKIGFLAIIAFICIVLGLIFPPIKVLGLQFLNSILEGLIKILWAISKFILSMIEVLEYMAKELLGLNNNISDYSKFAENVIVGDTNLLGYITRIFRYVVGVAIILMLVFTIYATIRNEYSYATGAEKSNDKGAVLKKLFKNLMSIVLMPIIFIMIILFVLLKHLHPYQIIQKY